jgi:hypothetical protein
MWYIILRGRWCDIINLTVHAPTEDKIYDVKDSFYEELECVFDKFPKYHMKVLLGDFSAKVGRENIFKPTIGNESLHNWVSVVNSATSKNLIVKSTMFPHPNIHKFTWTSDGLVVRVSGYRSRGPGFDFRRFQMFWEALGLERGPLSLLRTTEELLGRNSSGSGQENRD